MEHKVIMSKEELEELHRRAETKKYIDIRIHCNKDSIGLLPVHVDILASGIDSNSKLIKDITYQSHNFLRPEIEKRCEKMIQNLDEELTQLQHELLNVPTWILVLFGAKGFKKGGRFNPYK